jgi:CheY-like chemotaxis protein
MAKKILIADDEAHILTLLEARLSKAGYSVIKAATGIEAVALAKKELPALIISDIMMPDIDGGEVSKILESDPVTKDIPIIFLTALLRKEEEKGREKVSGRYFIAKPFDAEELLRVVEKCLEQK